MTTNGMIAILGFLQYTSVFTNPLKEEKNKSNQRLHASIKERIKYFENIKREPLKRELSQIPDIKMRLKDFKDAKNTLERAFILRKEEPAPRKRLIRQRSTPFKDLVDLFTEKSLSKEEKIHSNDTKDASVHSNDTKDDSVHSNDTKDDAKDERQDYSNLKMLFCNKNNINTMKKASLSLDMSSLRWYSIKKTNKLNTCFDHNVEYELFNKFTKTEVCDFLVPLIIERARDNQLLIQLSHEEVSTIIKNAINRVYTEKYEKTLLEQLVSVLEEDSYECKHGLNVHALKKLFIAYLLRTPNPLNDTLKAYMRCHSDFIYFTLWLLALQTETFRVSYLKTEKDKEIVQEEHLKSTFLYERFVRNFINTVWRIWYIRKSSTTPLTITLIENNEAVVRKHALRALNKIEKYANCVEFIKDVFSFENELSL